ncbi:hypothetical protein AZF37_01005 [endosymbiont 'TC1' of Trimyema compressum]|nr:Ig-like domain-containing protein [endosymbiont 'TC1' of Trimyema compressum]AMP19947.1 hypothetical protein AZF37_01005 [endosymbiont 'TC1' of Trimyema compressum]
MRTNDVTLYAVWKINDKAIAEVFADKNLALAIAEQLTSGDVNAILTENMINSCTTLNSESKGITNLVGIGKLVNLKQLLLANNKIMSLPLELVNLVNLTDLTLDNQQITLQKMSSNSSFTLASPIKNQNGDSVPPNSSFGDYVINGNDITWNNLNNQVSSVSFTFEQEISLGKVKATFSGMAIKPLDVEIAYVLSFGLNGGEGNIPPSQSVKSGSLAIVR